MRPPHVDIRAHHRIAIGDVVQRLLVPHGRDREGAVPLNPLEFGHRVSSETGANLLRGRKAVQQVLFEGEEVAHLRRNGQRCQHLASSALEYGLALWMLHPATCGRPALFARGDEVHHARKWTEVARTLLPRGEFQIDYAGVAVDPRTNLFLIVAAVSYQAHSCLLIAVYSATTAFRSSPNPSISTSHTSPGRMKTGGLRTAPMPAGVPITRTSPCSNVMNSDSSATVVATSKIMSEVEAFCMLFPF